MIAIAGGIILAFFGISLLLGILSAVAEAINKPREKKPAKKNVPMSNLGFRLMDIFMGALTALSLGAVAYAAIS